MVTTGKKPSPPVKTMEIIAKALGVTPEYFDEYRIKKAKEIIEENPEIADAIIAEDKSRTRAKREGKSKVG